MQFVFIVPHERTKRELMTPDTRETSHDQEELNPPDLCHEGMPWVSEPGSPSRSLPPNSGRCHAPAGDLTAEGEGLVRAGPR